VITKMKPGDRCGIVGFTSRGYRVQDLTCDILKLNTAIDSLGRGGGTRIHTGLSEALSIFEEQSDDSRQKFIILLSDGEDSYMKQSIEQATLAGESDIRIFAMMIGTGTLQMQNIAIYSRGIYKNSPTAEEIGEIMSYFASEVFDTASRNMTFRTIIKDKDMLDLSV